MKPASTLELEKKRNRRNLNQKHPDGHRGVFVFDLQTYDLTDLIISSLSSFLPSADRLRATISRHRSFHPIDLRLDRTS